MIHILNNIFHAIIPIAHAQEAAAPEGPVQTLGINWKLFIAQLVNVAIIYLILKKWVFGPLAQKMEERTSKIEYSLKQAEDIQHQHEAAEKERAAAIQKARLEASEIISKAELGAQKIKEQIVDEAKANAEKIIVQAKKDIESQKERLIAEVREEAATLIVSATEKIIREKLDPKKDEQLIKESLKGAAR